MSEKVIGYALITVGIAVMIISALNIYNLFTLSTYPVKLFNLPAISIDMSSLVGNDVPKEQLDEMKSQGKLRTELISADVLNQPLNLAAHLFLISFFLNAGFKVASLGVQFVRPIKVTLRESKEKDSITTKTITKGGET